MTVVVHANLDAEAAWSGVRLPAAVERRISLVGTLAATLVPEGPHGTRDDVELWTPAPVDAGRVLHASLALRAGTPPSADLAWADPRAKQANDRRWALALGRAHGLALPGARVIASLDELAGMGPWIAKVPWTAAGRDRARGAGLPDGELRARMARLLARTGELVVEPWCERVAATDAGQCATVDASGTVRARPPHGLLVDARGGFVGIDLAAPALYPEELAELARAVDVAGAALAAIGYAGPFGIDAFAYVDDGHRRFRPLVEINARYTFGWVAHALAERRGIRRLGFGPAPRGATTLIAPGNPSESRTDGVTAWCA